MLRWRAVAPTHDLDRDGAIRVLGGEHGRVAGELLVGLAAGLDLDDEQILGLHEADREHAAQPAQPQLELVEAHRGHCWRVSYRNPSAPRASIRSVSTGSSSGGDEVEARFGGVQALLVVVQRPPTRVQHLTTEAGHVDDDRGVVERVELDQLVERADTPWRCPSPCGPIPRAIGWSRPLPLIYGTRSRRSPELERR